MKILKKNCLAKEFYSFLTDRKISDNEFENVFNVWNKFEMKIIKDYQCLYLKCGVLSLAVFEKFRNNSLKNYGLYPSHYLSAPGLSWDAMLKIIKFNLNLFQVLTFIIRISYISNRYSKANNKCLKSYDPKQESKQITYLDANNL